MSERQFEARLRLGRLAVLATPLQQQLCQLLARGMGKPQGADFAAGAVVLVAELLRNPQAGIGVLLQEAQEILPFDEIHLARIHRLGRQLIGLATYRGTESQHLSRLGDFQDQCLAIGGADGEFYTAFAQYEDATWCLSLDKQDRALWVSGRVFDGFERLQCGWWKIAKDMLCPHLASQAAFYNVQTIRCKHDDPLYPTSYLRVLRPECGCDAPPGSKSSKSPHFTPLHRAMC